MKSLRVLWTTSKVLLMSFEFQKNTGTEKIRPQYLRNLVKGINLKIHKIHTYQMIHSKKMNMPWEIIINCKKAKINFKKTFKVDRETHHTGEINDSNYCKLLIRNNGIQEDSRTSLVLKKRTLNHNSISNEAIHQKQKWKRHFQLRKTKNLSAGLL